MTRPRRRLGRTHTELLLAVAQDDDREAFQELVDQLTGRLYRGAYRMVPPAYCDDLVQETWARAWKYRRGYQGTAQPHTWLYAVMRSAASSDTELRATANPDARVDEVACVNSAADFEAVLAADGIEAALRGLDRDEADVVRRRFLGEQEWSTIVTEMGFAKRRQAVKVYDRAMLKLKARYRDTPPGGGGPTRR